MPLRILFLSHKFYPDIGGIEINSEILANYFHNQGHDVHLLTWTQECGKKKFAFKVIRMPNFLTVIRQHQWADLVFENNPCLRLSYPNLIFRKPNFIALNTWVSRTDGSIKWQDKVKQWWFKRATGIIAVSSVVKERCFASATVIGNPYRQELFKKEWLEIPSQHSFVFLGRIVSDKGVSLAIEAFTEHIKKLNSLSILENSYPVLTIIGDGPERLGLEEFVKKNSLINKYVFFKGVLQGKELVSCLNKHRYMLVPSIWEEPFGNVVLEGMACGCIPIVSDGGGLPDAVGKAGLIFKRGDAKDLLAKITFITNNSEVESVIRNAASDHLLNHQPDIVARKYLEFMVEAIPKSS